MKANYNFIITFLNGHRLERSVYACSESEAHAEIWSNLSDSQQKDVERIDLDVVIYDSLDKKCK